MECGVLRRPGRVGAHNHCTLRSSPSLWSPNRNDPPIWKPLFFKRDMRVYIFDWPLEREICKPVLKLDFTAHGIMQEVTKRYRLSCLTNSALVYEPNAKWGGELRGFSQWVQLYTGAQINFGDLTPYLTYGHNGAPQNLDLVLSHLRKRRVWRAGGGG